jgi:hypothetical protein
VRIAPGRLGQPPAIRAIGIHHVNINVAAVITGEDDSPAIVRPGWKLIVAGLPFVRP